MESWNTWLALQAVEVEIHSDTWIRQDEDLQQINLESQWRITLWICKEWSQSFGGLHTQDLAFIHGGSVVQELAILVVDSDSYS